MRDESALLRLRIDSGARLGGSLALPERVSSVRREVRNCAYVAYGIEAASTLAPSSMGTRGAGIVAWYFSLTASM